MKKYLSGIVAISLGIGLNAFTPVNETATVSSAFANYFWYEVSGNTTLAPCANPMATVSKATAMATFVHCTDTGVPNCFLGSANNSLPPGSSISSPPADARIRYH